MRWYDRLRRQSEFAAVRRRGRQAGAATLAAFALEGPAGPPRIGVTVSKAVGGAVVRNRIRRRVLGALDARGPGPMPARVLIVVRPAAALESYERLAHDLNATLGRLVPVRR
ncbi:MAG TPA: ribonuclease P protein component [Candidatus Baltobacteraceae bacterium]|nr:ribonuclease P protein component [Candidatus Baltobacteraceae bacterium]